ncbi:MAG: hypothetical protein WAU53_16940, partial [Rhodoplanes sp.]
KGIDTPRPVTEERISFQWNRNSLSLSLSGRIFCGEPVSTSPENALAQMAILKLESKTLRRQLPRPHPCCALSHRIEPREPTVARRLSAPSFLAGARKWRDLRL